MAYLEGVYSDVVLSAAGVPVAGASVALYSAAAWAAGVLPVGDPPAPAATLSSAGSAVTDAAGGFRIAGLRPGDYHALVTYTPPGGTEVVLWRYNLAIAPAGLGLRTASQGAARAMPRSLARLLAPGTAGGLLICCIGDGVTVGYNATGVVSGGWVAQLASRLAAAYPTAGVTRYDPTSYGTTSDAAIPGWSSAVVQAQGAGAGIGVINAGVTGDTALRALRRMANFGSASWFPVPDLYLVMLGVAEMGSDTTRKATAADLEAALVGLVGCLRAGGAEVVLLTPPAGPSAGGAPAGGGVFDDYVDAVRAAAAQAGAGLCDVRQRWLDHYVVGAANDGYGTWLSTGTGDHSNPTDAGHGAIADEVAKLFVPLADEVPSRGVAPVGGDWERVRLLNASPTQLVFTGTWAATSNANFASGREYTSSTTNDTVTFNARFTDLYLLAGRWHDGGQLKVTIDAADWGTIDLYRANPVSTADIGDYHNAIVPQEEIFVAGPLADVVHSVTLKVLATANASSSGHACRVDALDCLRLRASGQLLETVVPLQRVMAGSKQVTLSAVASNTATITFPQSFPNGAAAVSVVATIASGGTLYCCSLSSITASQATLTVYTRDGSNASATVTVDWVAVG